jgi:hypothetical protein
MKASEASRIGRFLAMVVDHPPELQTGPESHADDYVQSMAQSLGSAIRRDSRLRERSEEVDAHRARVHEWFQTTIMPRRNEDSTLVVLANNETIGHVLACFLGSLEKSLTDYVIRLGCARFHLIRSVPADESRSVWKIECIDAPI